MNKIKKLQLAIVVLAISIFLIQTHVTAVDTDEENVSINTQAFVVRIKLSALYPLSENNKLKPIPDVVLLPRIVKALEREKDAQIISHMTVTTANGDMAHTEYTTRVYTPFKKQVTAKDHEPCTITEYKWIATETEFTAEPFYEEGQIHIEYKLNTTQATQKKDTNDILDETSNYWQGQLKTNPGSITIVTQTTNADHATLLIIATKIYP